MIQNAGANGFKWLRVEKEMGLYLENVTLEDCEICLSAEGLGSSHRISFRESSLKNGSMMLVGGGLDLRNTSMENLNLNQSSATLMNRVQESSIKNSKLTLSQGLQSSGNNWDNTSIQSLQTRTEKSQWDSNRFNIYLDLSSGASHSFNDTFSDSQIQFLSLNAEKSTFKIILSPSVFLPQITITFGRME